MEANREKVFFQCGRVALDLQHLKKAVDSLGSFEQYISFAQGKDKGKPNLSFIKTERLGTAVTMSQALLCFGF